MKNATMLYKFPGAHEMHGAKFDYIIVDEQDIDQAKKDGWHLTTTGAKEAAEGTTTEAPKAPAKAKTSKAQES